MSIHSLPTLNALLNATSAVLLALGYRFIRRREVQAHRACMVAAFVVSIFFLASYLTYHYHVGSVRFPWSGWVRGVYLTILATHTVLAAAVPPLAIVTLSRAIGARFDTHRRIARWTLPIWFYVSVTGVVVYWMLYHLAGAHAL
jgi:putative membrane protein